MSDERAREIADRLDEDEIEAILLHNYYLASCDHCGWIGSSHRCGTDGGISDDSDVYCPMCDRSGCDRGKEGEKHDAAVRRILEEQRQC